MRCYASQSGEEQRKNDLHIRGKNRVCQFRIFHCDEWFFLLRFPFCMFFIFAWAFLHCVYLLFCAGCLDNYANKGCMLFWVWCGGWGRMKRVKDSLWFNLANNTKRRRQQRLREDADDDIVWMWLIGYHRPFVTEKDRTAGGGRCKGGGIMLSAGNLLWIADYNRRLLWLEKLYHVPRSDFAYCVGLNSVHNLKP